MISPSVQNEKEAFRDVQEQNPGTSRKVKMGVEKEINIAQVKMQHVKKPKSSCVVFFTLVEASKVTAALAYKLYRK